MKLQKAAMFGLDARIALAIFGALSVISGAALYSAIKEAKTVAAYQELSEVVKASEQYLLDTGQYLIRGSNDYHLYSGDLIENSQGASDWQGPYLPYTRIDSLDFRTNLKNLNIRIYRYDIGDWNADDSVTPTFCSVGVNACGEFLLVDGKDALDSAYLTSLFNDLDARYDNSDGASKGQIRKRTYDPVNNTNIYFQGIIRQGE